MSNDSCITANSDNLSYCNFTPKIKSIVDVIRPYSTEQRVRIMLEFNNGTKSYVNLPLSSLEKTDWKKVDPRCIIDSKVKNASEKIAGFIRSQLFDESIPHERYYITERIGLHHINGTIVFVAGDLVRTRSSAKLPFIVKYGGTRFKFDIDNNISPQEAFNGMTELISLVPGVGWIAVAQTISGIIRDAFIESGFTPTTTIMFVGESGMRKSSYLPQITQIYNRKSGVKADTRFNSSIPFAEKYLHLYQNCTVVIDDIHTAASAKIKNRNETTAEELIRQISDNIGRGHMVGNELVQDKFDGNAVFIGEYPIGAGSAIPRLLYVEFNKKPDGKILHKYQGEKKLLMSTFYSYFIQWYVDNYEAIRQTIYDRLTKFRSFDKMSQVHGRLADIQFYLQISVMIMLEYCIESGFISQEEANSVLQKFAKYVSQLIKKQQHIYSQQSSVPVDLNYLNIIKEMYNGCAFKLAKDVKKFDLDKHDGLIYYECLCIRNDKLDAIIGTRLESYNRAKMINELKAKGALKLNNDGKNTIQIGALKGKRFLAIYLKELR